MKYISTEKGLEKMTDEQYEDYLESQKTPEQKTQEKIAELKSKLSETDYQALKAFEGIESDEWETIKANRETWRQAIRELASESEEVETADSESNSETSEDEDTTEEAVTSETETTEENTTETAEE